MTYLFDPFRLSVPERELWRGDALVPIEPKVFDLLAYLVAHRDRAVGRDELIAAVWGRTDLADGTLAQTVLRLRRVLEDNGAAPRYVRTLPRHGYRWIAPTRESAAAPPPSDPDHRTLPPEPALVPPLGPVAEAPAATASRPARAPWGRVLLGLGLVLGVAAGYRAWRSAAPPSPAEQLRVGRAADALPALEAAQQRDPGALAVAVQVAEARCALESACGDTLDALLARDLPPPLRARALQARASLRIDKRQFAEAASDLDAAQALAVDVAASARTTVLRASLALAQRQNEEARALAQRARTQAERVDDRVAGGDAAYVMGVANLREGRGDEALKHFGVAIDAFERSGDLTRLARAHAIRSHTLGHLGRFEEALAAASAAMRAATAQQAPAAVREALNALAWAQLQRGRIADARETVHQALREGSVARNAEQQFQLISLLGFIEAAGGRFREAIEAWDAALRLDGMPDAGPSAAGTHLALLYAALNAGDAARARSEGERIEEAARSAPSLEQYALHARALLAGADGDWPRAIALYRQVWDRARRSGTLNQQMLADYAEALFQRDDLATVETLLGEASASSSESYLRALIEARYLARRGDAVQAQQAFDRARLLMGERYSSQLELARAEIAAARRAGGVPAVSAQPAAGAQRP